MSNFYTRQDFAALRQEVEDLGCFRTSSSRFYALLAAIALLFISGALLRGWSEVLAIALASIGGITLVWWIHDAGHDAYFKSKRESKFWIEAAGILFLGMPQIEYHYEVHRRHHGFTNIIGKDGALETGPVIWDERQLDEKRKSPLPLQSFVWFLFVLPLTWPLINLRCIQTLIKRKSYFRLAMMAVRWTALPMLLGFDWAFIMIPILITGFVLGFSASLNHFHMQMGTRSLAPFPESVFLTTQNLSNRSLFMTWLTGGLNFHIEHHLFPNVPSYQLKKIAPLVQSFAAQHGLPYAICTEGEAVRRLFNRLSQPTAIGTSPARSQELATITQAKLDGVR